MYTSINNVIIFHSEFNEIFNEKIKKIVSKHKKIIFANCNIITNKKDHRYTDPEKVLSIYIKSKHDFDFDNPQEICSFAKSKFNKPIDNNLPQGIISLILGWSFSQSVDNLPIGLKEITFGHEFNNPVDNLPFTLESVVFGYTFNCPIDNLPNSIKKIYLGELFNQKIDDLPNGLETIIIGKLFTYSINCLPKSLINLTIKSNYENSDIYQLPWNLQSITFTNEFCYPYAMEKYNRDNISFKFCNKIKFY